MTHLSKVKYSLLSGIIILAAAPQFAAAQSSVTASDFYRCEALADKDAQLSCFLAETAKLRAAEPNAAAPITVDKTSVSQIPQAGIQEAEIKAPEAATPEVKQAEIRQAEIKQAKAKVPQTSNTRKLPIASTSTFGRYKFVRFTLENGEVWKQTERDRVRLGHEEPDILTIKRGAVGGAFARVNDKGTWIRVKQVE